jgi:hypothetical protein
MVPVFSNISITFSRLPDFAKPFNTVVAEAKIVPPTETPKDGTA